MASFMAWVGWVTVSLRKSIVLFMAGTDLYGGLVQQKILQHGMTMFSQY